MAEFAYDKPKNRSRILILHSIAEFSLSKTFGGERTFGGLKEYSFEASSSGRAVPGDLVALSAAPASKWYLAWVASQQNINGWDQWTLESIEDGELCNWSNVGLMYLNRQTVAEHPEWRWTDEQHDFNDRWLRACYKQRDAYIQLPIRAHFEGKAVTLGVRIRFGWRDPLPTRTFPNWNKVTRKAMLEYFDEMVALDEARTAKSAEDAVA